MSSRYFMLPTGALLMLLLSACAPLNHNGNNVLSDFSAVAEAIQENTQFAELIEKHRDTVRERDLNNPNYGFKTLQALQLEFDQQDIFSHKLKGKAEELPRFVHIDNFSVGLAEVNESFSEYLILLEQLAAPENLLDVDAYDAYSEAIYHKSWRALRKLGKDKSHNHDHKRDIAGLSGGLLRVYTTKRHQRTLTEVVIGNQPILEDYFSAVRRGIKQMGVGIRDDYDTEAAEIMESAIARGVKENYSDAIKEMFELSRSTQIALETLRVMDELYAEIIRQHRLLPQVIEKGNMSLSFLRARLHKLVQLREALEALEVQEDAEAESEHRIRTGRE